MRISDWSSDVCSSDLTQLSADYDLIILDSTPVFGMSYALILGCLAQKTVLVTRRGWTTQSKAMQAARQLVLCGADLDRKGVGTGKSVSGRVKLGGRGISKKKMQESNKNSDITR